MEDTNNMEENVTVCEVRRRIEDRHEQRRYEDELGDYQSFELLEEIPA